jgi:hypothetical protein
LVKTPLLVVKTGSGYPTGGVLMLVVYQVPIPPLPPRALPGFSRVIEGTAIEIEPPLALEYVQPIPMVPRFLRYVLVNLVAISGIALLLLWMYDAILNAKGM